MLTKNFYALLLNRFTNISPTIRICDGTKKTIYQASEDTLLYSFKGNVVDVAKELISSEQSTRGFVFGDGATPPTIDDLTLSGSYITGIQIKQNSVEADFTTNMKMRQFLTIKNASESTITIREVGRVAYGDVNSSSSNYNYYSFLLERSVLDTPLTLAPDESALITLEVAVV